MGLKHIIGLFANPADTWNNIKNENFSIGKIYRGYILAIAAIPPLAFYYGTTEIGWSIGSGGSVEKFPHDIGLLYSGLFYIAILFCIFIMGAVINWMAKTYEVKPDLPLCISLSAFSVTPLLLVGITLIYPIPWLLLLLSLGALAYTIYLLYLGVPIMMEIPREKGFLYASAILAFGLIMLIGMLATMVVLWDYGLAPTYTS